MWLPTSSSKCPDCGYPRQGLPDSGRCPECGLEYGEWLVTWDGWQQRVFLSFCCMFQAVCLGFQSIIHLDVPIPVVTPGSPFMGTVVPQPNWIRVILFGCGTVLMVVCALYMLVHASFTCYVSVQDRGLRVRQGKSVREESWENIRRIDHILFRCDRVQLHHGRRIVIPRPSGNAKYEALMGRVRARLAHGRE